MKKGTFWNILRFVPCLLFLGIITSLFVRNMGTFLKYTQETLPSGYKAYTQSIDKHLSENLAGKYDYINLNGSAFRLLGLNTLNECFRLENGYLASFSVFTDIDASADDVKALSDFLEQKDIPFLYTYIPAKEHSFDARVSAEYASNIQNPKVKELAQALDARQVNHLDLDGWFQENGWKMEDIYFRTDHHWLPEAAFTAARLIMERFSETGGAVFQEETLDPENWTFEVYEDIFLGSQGKKTGQAYAGVDDLCLITPNFPVETYIGRVHPDRTISNFDSSTVYWPAGLEGENVFHRNPYGVYIGNSYPYLYLRNDLAVNQKKILIIGDSYRLPTECFLTTQFSEIFHVDMREYVDGSFATMLNQIQPDLVLYICVLPVYNDVQNFGLEEWARDFGEKTLGAPCLEYLL